MLNALQIYRAKISRDRTCSFRLIFHGNLVFSVHMEIKSPEFYAAWRAQQAEKLKVLPPPVFDRGTQVRDRNLSPDKTRQIHTAEEQLRQMQGRLDGYISAQRSFYRSANDSRNEQLTSAMISSLEKSVREKKAEIAKLKSQTPSSTRNV